MSKPADRLGMTIAGRYLLTKVLGSGGMGAVYAADDSKTRRSVALKVIPNTEKGIVDRFKREAKTLAALSHPNTISVFDFGEGEGVLYLAMEQLDGFSLEEALARYRRFSAYDAVSVAKQVALSLTEAHNAGIVHRDIKPANIFLTKADDGEFFVKVLDFGIAKTFANNAETKLTREGSLVGTPRYMPPEQIRTQEVDQRSDIYSLACVLFEMLSGRPPFLADNMADLLIQHLKENVPPLSRFVSADELRHIPPELDSAISRALSKEPRMRQKSMAEFARDLELSLGQIEKAPNPMATPTTVSLEMDRPGLQSVSRTPRPAPEVKAKPSRLLPIFGVTSVLVFVVALISIVYFSQVGPKEGETCDEDGLVLCGTSEYGSKAILGCRKGVLGTLQACDGRCVPGKAGGASCGPTTPTVAIEGGYCNVADASACSAAGAAALRCRGLKWEVARHCTPAVCELKDDVIQCQGNVYTLGDPCDFADTSRACSNDFKHLLRCENGTTVVDIDCSESDGQCTELISGDRRELTCHVFSQAVGDTN